ncbi:cilia- and flagella-associated protein 36 isoform X2 [Denticeps clupeoides]|uniref:Cilia- and flagella-associated protein 36 n=1 Tax=Denticeps clupeoides TaxID=299321 RepID=A0AAY4ECP4_9TELE|nr:cilia- and flagella-associated protein 36 isoform X2 [Denticeps clupeoides]
MAEDTEWVVESIAGYLGSPEWTIPVADFMENKCTVFDDEDENKLTYTEIHQQYKELVEKLLENYMQEVGINEQQFLHACSSPFAKSKTLQAVFQPVLATDDFQMFRSLMVQKNMELQLQALRMIKERNGALPDCLVDGVDVMSELEQQEMRILQEVLKRSKEEYDLEMARHVQFEEEVGTTSSSCSIDSMPNGMSLKEAVQVQVSSASKVSTVATQKGEKRSAVPPTRDKEQQSPAKLSPALAANLPSEMGSECGKTLPAVRVPPKASAAPTMPRENSSGQAAQSWLEEAHKEAGISKPFAELSAAQQEQLQQRALYLRQQRDKLHALKKEQRPKQATPEDVPAAPTPAPGSQEISVEEKKKLQKRKHLAEKLKEEVIKK